jgi:HD superfamily phosphohydrolase
MAEVHDDVYGSATITEGLLLDLLRSQAIQRLKGISQAGASSLVRLNRTVTRYEHSVGVMLLTRILGGSAIEQSAGLLQDVSHTAFSHTIDYVYGDRSESFHERIIALVLSESDVPSVLQKHGMIWEDVFHPSNLKRIDASAPSLCADRIDYTLRDLLRLGDISSSEVGGFVSSLDFCDGSVVVTDPEWAVRFVSWYRHLVGDIFMDPLELYAHDELGRIIRAALDVGIITEADLRKTDSDVIKTIESSVQLAGDFRELSRTRTVCTDGGPGSRRVFSKARVIDPLVMSGGRLARLSAIYPHMYQVWGSIINISREGVLVRKGL